MKSKYEERFIYLLNKSIKTKNEIAEMQQIRIFFEEELRAELSKLSEELAHAGCHYTDVWDLVNTKKLYPEAIDILIKHLLHDYHDKNKEGIIRALTVKEAKGKAAIPLIRAYERTPKEKENLRWIIGHAIATVMTTENVSWIISAVLDKTNGISRGQLVLSLGTVKSEEVEKALKLLVQDEEVAPQALEALRKLGYKKNT